MKSASGAKFAPLQIAGWSAAVAVAGQVFWFLALYPLVPSTPRGWAAATAAGLAVTLWAAACIAALQWIQARHRHAWAFKAIGLVIALSLGLGVFAAAFQARAFISANASYFGR